DDKAALAAQRLKVDAHTLPCSSGRPDGPRLTCRRALRVSARIYYLSCTTAWLTFTTAGPHEPTSCAARGDRCRPHDPAAGGGAADRRRQHPDLGAGLGA